MGNYTKDNKPDHVYSTPSWVQYLSCGGITEPTAYWVMQTTTLKNIFKKFHKDKVDLDSKIVKRLTTLTKKIM